MEMYEFWVHDGAIISDMSYSFIVGIDEVGRGPIAGPVCVGMVIMEKKNEKVLRGIKDSKKLNPKKREEWFKKISWFKREKKLDFFYAMIGPSVIDKIGINKAIQKAINNCCSKYLAKCSTPGVEHFVLLDGGLKAPEEFKNQKTIIKGDEKIPVISAASIVAKVMRDRRMVTFSKKYPKYGFEKHKGYGTKNHYKKIKKSGLSPIHRISFIH